MEDKKQTVRAVERALDVLLCFTKDTDLSLTEISKSVSLNKSTVHRLLASLMGKGFLLRDPLTDRYRLGMRIWELSSSLLRDDDPALVFLPQMESLRDVVGETISLYVRDGRERIRIQVIESKQPIRRVARIGKRLPLAVGASGKVLTSFETSQIKKYIFEDPEWPIFVDKQQYKKQLDQINQQGYAVSIEEREQGTSAVAAPIFDHHNHLIAALSVSGPVSRLTEERVSEIASVVIESALNMGKMIVSRQ